MLNSLNSTNLTEEAFLVRFWSQHHSQLRTNSANTSENSFKTILFTLHIVQKRWPWARQCKGNTCCMVLVHYIACSEVAVFLGENEYIASTQWRTKILVDWLVVVLIFFNGFISNSLILLFSTLQCFCQDWTNSLTKRIANGSSWDAFSNLLLFILYANVSLSTLLRPW